MEYHEIGKTGIHIPAILFGTSALGNLYRKIDEGIKLEILKECLKYPEGPVAFDSAGKYGAGLALESLGRQLRKLQPDPDRIIISNKLGWLRTELTGAEPDFEKGVWVGIGHNARLSIGYEGIIDCWQQGNELLGETYAPRLVSVHDPDEYLQSAGDNETDRRNKFEDIKAAYRALADLKTDGQVKAIGVGAKDWHVVREMVQDIELDWVMFANSLTLYSHPKELVAFMTELQEAGVAVINSAVFNAGFLIGGAYFDYRHIDVDDPANRSLVTWREQFFKICREFSMEPAQACIHFGQSHPAIQSIALNTSNPEHVKRNIDAVESTVPAQFYTAMKEAGLIDREYPYV